MIANFQALIGRIVDPEPAVVSEDEEQAEGTIDEPDPQMEILMKLAFAAIAEAKARRSKISLQDYLKISRPSAEDLAQLEDALNLDGAPSFSDLDPPDTSSCSFIDFVEPRIFKLLRFMGNLQVLVSGDFFMGEQHSQSFHFQASNKVPFQFTLACNPHLRDAMMEDYKRNSANPLMVASYDTQRADLSHLAPSNSAVCRSVHVDDLYSAMPDGMLNLLCIGNGQTGKSSLLNALFGLAFEELSDGAAGLFHDSVDAVFASADHPIGFNVFDFHGYACRDHLLIEHLFKALPQSLILVQVTDLAYLTGMVAKLSKETRSALAARLLVVNRTKSKSAFVACKVEKVVPGFPASAVQDYKPTSALARTNEQQKLLAWLFRFKAAHGQQLALAFEERVRALSSDGQAMEFTGLRRTFWLFSDHLAQHASAGTKLENRRTASLRNTHRRIKQLLFGPKSDLLQLTREKVFSRYTKEVKRYELLSEQRAARTAQQSAHAERRLAALDAQDGPASDIFKLFKTCVDAKDLVAIKDLWQVVESSFRPRLDEARQLTRSAMIQISGLKREVAEMLDARGCLKVSLSEDQRSRYSEALNELKQLQTRIKELAKQRTSFVLDPQLFIREAYLRWQAQGGPRGSSSLDEVLAKAFAQGRALEIVDGDTDMIHEQSLEAVLNWIVANTRRPSEVLVITIIGPQSTGKSTLMNFLFGSKFQVSAGRCTKGLNAMLLESEYEGARDVLVLDSEGLFSVERGELGHDRKLTMLCLSVTNLLLINIKGEISAEIVQVLQMAIYANQRISETQNVGRRPKLHFVLRDQIQAQPALLQKQYELLYAKFVAAARVAGKPLDEVLDLPSSFQDQHVFHLFSAAVSKVEELLQRPFHITRSCARFRTQCDSLRDILFSSAAKFKAEERLAGLHAWSAQTVRIWRAIQDSSELTRFETLEQVKSYSTLVESLLKFESIMESRAPARTDPAYSETHTNPLLLLTMSKDFEDEHHIKKCETLCALFEAQVKAATEQASSAPEKLEFIARMECAFGEAKASQLAKFGRQVEELTKDMGGFLQGIGELSLQRVVNRIHQRALQPWTEWKARDLAQSALRSSVQQTEADLATRFLRGEPVDEHWLSATVQRGVARAQEFARGLLEGETLDVHSEAKGIFDMLADQINAKVYLKLQRHIDQHQLIGRIQILQRGSQAITRGDSLSIFQQPGLHEALQAAMCAGKVGAELMDKLASYAIVNCGTQRSTRSSSQRATQGLSITSLLSRKPIANQVQQMDSIEAEIAFEIAKHFAALTNSVRETLRVFEQRLETKTLSREDVEGMAVGLVSLCERELNRQNMQGRSEKPSMPIYDQRGLIASFNRLVFHVLERAVAFWTTSRQKSLLSELEAEGTKALANLTQLAMSQIAAKDQAHALHKVIYSSIFSLLKADLKHAFSKRFLTLESVVDKPEVQFYVMNQFMEAENNQQGHALILRFMKDKLSLEHAVVERLYDQVGADVKKQILNEFSHEINPVINGTKELSRLIQAEMAERSKDLFKSSVNGSSEHLFNFLAFVLAGILQPLCSSARLEPFRNTGINDEKFKDLLRFSSSFSNVFSRELSTSDADFDWLDPNLARLKEIANALPDCYALLRNLYSIKSSEIEIIAAQARCELEEELQTVIDARPNLGACIESAVGCPVSCNFCGARCERELPCRVTGQCHQAAFHLPMAFMGTSKEGNEPGRRLLNDYCDSATMILSRWSSGGQTSMSEVELVMQRCEKQGLQTDGLNIYLEWVTGSDLDIQVRCACGTWHGYGTQGMGSSQGRCFCQRCRMKRDYDMVEAREPRRVTPAYEHVIFEQPEAIVGKPIEFKVYCYENGTKQPRNDFKVALINSNGYQLYPQKGGRTLEQQGWMSIPASDRVTSRAESFVLSQNDLSLFEPGKFKTYEQHAGEVNPGWSFKRTDIVNVADLPEYKEILQCCQEKWVFVSGLVCGPAHFNCEALPEITIVPKRVEAEEAPRQLDAATLAALNRHQ